MSPVPSELPSKKAIDRAGRRLALAYLESGLHQGRETMSFSLDPFEDAAAFLSARDAVLIWRRAHAYPLRKTSANLRHYVREVPDAQVAQRLKKFATIIDKLERFEQMKLSRMEDIGGCRVVVANMDEVRDLARRLKKNWTVTRDRDYVSDPKQDGYRPVQARLGSDGGRGARRSAGCGGHRRSAGDLRSAG